MRRAQVEKPHLVRDQVAGPMSTVMSSLSTSGVKCHDMTLAIERVALDCVLAATGSLV
jgi:hypothetical protein